MDSRWVSTSRFIIACLMAALIVGMAGVGWAATPGTSSIIVKTAAGLSPDQVAAVIAADGGVEVSSVPALRLHVVEVPDADLATVIINYQNDPQVERVEQNQTRKVETIPSDPLYSDQWYLPRIGWDSAFGSWLPFGQATVAILDTGVDAFHPDLAGNMVAGTSIIDASGGTTDPNGHGTNLAGIVAAVSNDIGIAGVGYSGVRIMPVTVLGADGTGKDADIIAGILYAVDHGASVILMGFSNAGFSQNLQDAIDYAWSRDVVLVAAVGNDSISDPTYPAGDRGVMGVSSTDAADALSTFSNYGKDVFIAAPGEGIVTTGLDHANYTVASGTSASSAIVAGVAAFLRAYDATLTNGAVVGRIAISADAAGNSTDETGNGRINMASALSDTSFNPIEPVGAPGGGPYVGPYRIAGNSSISGTVKDSNGNTMSGVTVTCTSGSNVTPGPFTTTNSAGVYGFNQANGNKITYSGTTGNLTLTASKAGYTNDVKSQAVSNGGTYTINFTLTPADTTPPVLSLPADITAEATGPSGAVVTFTATANDLVDGAVAVTCVPASGSTFAIGDTTVNCSATDAHGNTATGSFKVTVDDTTPPVVTAPAAITVEATGPTTAVTLGTAMASDLVDGTLTPTPSETGPFSVGVHTITWSATDAAGNTGTATQTVTVQDTTPPVVTAPADITIEATGPSGAVVTFTATANDLVDGSVSVTCVPASGSTFAIGDTTVNCSATDAHGNTATGSFKVTVDDTTPPSLPDLADVTVEATGPSGAVATYGGSATDLVDGSLALSFTPDSGATFPLGDTTVTYTATDAHGNTAVSKSFTVHVVDTTAPSLPDLADVTVEATGPSGAVANYSGSATDIVDGSIALSFTPDSGATFPLGDTTVTYTATDAHGNTAVSKSFKVKVQDTTPPVVTAPAAITIEATGPTTAVTLGTATASDLVDGNVAPVTPSETGPFTVGVHTITWSATDAHNNTGTATQTVTVQDTTPPVVTAPAAITIEATGPTTAVTLGTATASDLVDGNVAPVTPSETGPFTVGVHTITWSATDAHNNTGTATQTVTVQDTTPPAVTAPAAITVEATGPTTAVTLGTATASDLVDGTLTPVTPNETGPFTVGVHTITWSATDAHNNTGTATQTVTVQDTTPPVLTVPADITVIAGPIGYATVNFNVTATDLVDSNPTVTVLPPSGSNFYPGTTTVTCTATDNAGNQTIKTFNVNVPYTFGGFLNPVALGDTLDGKAFKQGSTIPVKFQLTDASGKYCNLCSVNAAPKLYVLQVGRGNLVQAEGVETLPPAPADSGFRYDATDNQYIYNLSTKSTPAMRFNSGYTYQIWATLSDGQTIIGTCRIYLK